MFQVKSSDNELQNILKQELDFFSSILQFSEKFVQQVESLPVNMLSKMVNYRQEWIEKIQRLEEKRKEVKEQKKCGECEEYMKKISKLAEKLVEVDRQIHQHLQDRKMKCIQNHSAIAGQSSFDKKQAANQINRSKRLDIIQG